MAIHGGARDRSSPRLPGARPGLRHAFRRHAAQSLRKNPRPSSAQRRWASCKARRRVISRYGEEEQRSRWPAAASDATEGIFSQALSARVVEIEDPDAALGSIQLGNIVLGRFAFDPDLADRDPAPGSGDWTAFGPHDPGITILEVLAYSINDVAYRGTTIPAREVIDNGETGDRLRFGGCEGPGVPLRFCFLAELADAGGNALEAAAWSTEVDLTRWPVHTLSIFSPPRLVGTDTDLVGPTFSLRAEITDWRSELRPIPEPGAFGIFGLGLTLLARLTGGAGGRTSK